MGKVKKGLKNIKVVDSINKQEDNGDSLKLNEEFDGASYNPFSVDNDFEANGGNINIQIITDDEEMPEDEGSILSRLLYLSDFLNEKYKASVFLKEEEWENMKWETINETYCLITVDLPRKQAELIRKYFRRLDTTYVKKDGTYYSVIVKGHVAKEIIEDLIEVYPWDEVDENKANVNWGGFHKSENGEDTTILINPSEKSGDISHGLYGDKIKYAIGNLSKSIDKLNEILSAK